MTKSGNWLIAAVILALGMIVGGYLLGDGLTRANLSDRSVTVRGLAEREVTADLATWTIRFTAQGNDFETVKRQTGAMANSARMFLKEQGFADAAISAPELSVNQWMNGTIPQVQIRQAIRLNTNDIARAEKAYAAQGALLDRGVAIEQGGAAMVYSFTRLTELKPEMIAEATKDARAAAEQFARDSGASVGGIKSARQGYFSIDARDGAVGSSGDSPAQKVRVVTTVDFYLRD
ncbi:SIMPL domain-containing protein [Pacificimonas sp. WHA3]|uniref:SIMPL domain-containing protein n=1 Tax=Pacificimonas pallii TaxID=2827236 RepID=A0ABS6SFY2_9SPHN|nr:SIMPL domain-containing protein [Pacificimonas pallii]MBV7257333.1 SIMPL domain-containing protein [Pacificimonas pallii]